MHTNISNLFNLIDIMQLEKRINAFVELGNFLRQFKKDRTEKNNSVLENDPFFEAFNMQINRAAEFNGWFNKDNVLFALESWSKALTKRNLDQWTSNYNLSNNTSKTIAIIMAGNIPLVGFHDLLSALIANHKVLIKQSSNDSYFLPILAKYIETVEPEFKNSIIFSQGKLDQFDAVIATGSNNTARYFDYYFGKYPNIIRKNRNSVAVLTGEESQSDLEKLGEDIFRYFGLGCRNVSKLLVPQDYDFDQFFKAIYKYHPIINFKKYENNYDYNKAVFLMSQFKILENGFLMLKEDTSYSSPIAALFYEFYDHQQALENKLNSDRDLIQCVVGKHNNYIDFGQAQQPKLWDYADGVDTLKFLNELQ